MGRPSGNGLIELVDEKSQERGFFCMKLTGYILKEREEHPELDIQDLWEQRFSEAKSGSCAYIGICPIYARTKKVKGFQLSLEFM